MNERRPWPGIFFPIAAAALMPVPALLAAPAVLTAMYALNYYRADQNALAVMAGGAKGVTITEEPNGRIVFMPDEPQAGLVFYPGARVALQAYAPLLCALAGKGICCVIVPAVLHTPTLSPDAADGVVERFPQITRWYIGGHSLGGTVAAMYLQKHPGVFSGLIMLGAYSVTDLSAADIFALVIYGENDGLRKTNMNLYAANAANLPRDTVTVCIPGGCHSYFGSYGLQAGDGTPTITAARQQAFTADTIAARIIGPQAGPGIS